MSRQPKCQKWWPDCGSLQPFAVAAVEVHPEFTAVEGLANTYDGFLSYTFVQHFDDCITDILYTSVAHLCLKVGGNNSSEQKGSKRAGGPAVVGLTITAAQLTPLHLEGLPILCQLPAHTHSADD